MPTLAFTSSDALNLVYLLAAVAFILGLKYLSQVKTAARGNLISAGGMLLAAVATFFYISGGEWISLIWVFIALLIGTAIGVALATKVKMEAMPQMVALLNGFGGIASLLVACADYANLGTLDVADIAGSIQGSTSRKLSDEAIGQAQIALSNMSGQELEQWRAFIYESQSWYALLATGLAILIGGVTFTGSIMAFGKLQGAKWAPDSPVQFTGQKGIIGVLLGLALILSFVLIWWPASGSLVPIIAVAALVLGVLLVIGIGGSDMPVVVALLNSYSGLAASMAGFVLGNFALIITGALVGASGLILTSIMCKAMNRSLVNVLFGGVGGGAGGGGTAIEGTHREFQPDEAAIVMEAAGRVMIVPGYGMAVAQAQHAVKDLADLLKSRGIEVSFAIHPVAGRMPGHMNVLLADAGIEHEQLLDLEHANPEFEQTDVALVIGANDVTNPAARHATDSPIYGMPILDVDKARQVFVIKRSLSPGFAGIQNELYFMPNTGMIFGDAKSMVGQLMNEIEQI